MNTVITEQSEQKRGLSGSSLKLIAVITMLIDHVGAGILGRLMMARGFMDIASAGGMAASIWLQENAELYYGYLVMRKIGRIAFPIFVFLIVEGFQRTRSKEKYVLRMAVFALLSEIPFDLVFKGQILEFTYQNIFFTLLIGLMTMLCFDFIERTDWNGLLQLLAYGATLVAGLGLAELLKTDYGAKGVICIMVVYIFRRNRFVQLVAGAISFLWEMPASLAFLPIAFYNGTRGLKLKYIFYVFYPLHLLIIYVISVIMGISGYPAG